MLSGERKKETKKIEQKDPMNKNDLANSERIWEMKILCKSQKIESEVSLRMVKNFCKVLKGKEASPHRGQVLPTGKRRHCTEGRFCGNAESSVSCYFTVISLRSKHCFVILGEQSGV